MVATKQRSLGDILQEFSHHRQVIQQELQKIMAAKPEMTVTVLNDEQRACFKDAAKEVEAKFIEMTGDSGKAILNQLKADLEATK